MGNRKIQFSKKALLSLKVVNPDYVYDCSYRRPVVSVYYVGSREPSLYTLTFVKDILLPSLYMGTWTKINKSIFTSII